MNRIKQLRKEKGLSIDKLSEELKKNGYSISPASISKYEREQRNPKIQSWKMLAKFFDVSVPYIQGISENKEDGATNANSIATTISTVTNIMLYIIEHPNMNSVPANILDGLKLTRYEINRLLEVDTLISNNIIADNASEKVKEYFSELSQIFDEHGVLGKETTPKDVLNIINCLYMLVVKDGLDSADDEFVITFVLHDLESIIDNLNDRLFGNEILWTGSGTENFRVSGELPPNVSEDVYKNIVALLRETQKKIKDLKNY